MLGLEDVVGLSVTHPVWGKTKPEQDEHCGWLFKTPGVDKDVIPLSGYGSVSGLCNSYVSIGFVVTLNPILLGSCGQ